MPIANTYRLTVIPETDDYNVEILLGTYIKGEKGDEPVLTADPDGTIYSDGEVLTEVIKDAKDQADADHTRADADHTQAEADHAAQAGQESRLAAIEGKIPEQASSTNQLADKEFVNSNITAAINTKVDKVQGKGLSTHDYTSEEKSKLDALPTNNDLTDALNAKQDTLVSGDNIKTINGDTLLGPGNIATYAPKVLDFSSFAPVEVHEAQYIGQPWIELGITQEEFTALTAGEYDIITIHPTKQGASYTAIGYKQCSRRSEVSYLMFDYDPDYMDRYNGYRCYIFSIGTTSYSYYNSVDADVAPEICEIPYDETALRVLPIVQYQSGYKALQLARGYTSKVYVLTKYQEGSYAEFGYFDGDTYYWRKAIRTSGTTPSSWECEWEEGTTSIGTKVSAWQATPDNDHYPSEKLVKDTLNYREEVWVAEDCTDYNAGGLYPMKLPRQGNWPVNNDLTESIQARVDDGTWENVKIIYNSAVTTSDTTESMHRNPTNEYIEWRIAKTYYAGDGKYYYRLFEAVHVNAFPVSYGYVNTAQ